LNDIAAEATHLTEGLPDLAAVWAIPEREHGLFADRLAAMARLQKIGLIGTSYGTIA
jgi:hypothetical protein